MSNAILLIEDDRWHRTIYSALLRAHGFRPIAIVDPRRTLTAARRTAPAAVLIDILLPHVDGRSVIRQLRGDDRTSAIPIVAISAGTDPDMAETCLDAGANQFRTKPVPLLTLVNDIQHLIDGDRAAASTL